MPTLQVMAHPPPSAYTPWASAHGTDRSLPSPVGNLVSPAGPPNRQTLWASPFIPGVPVMLFQDFLTLPSLSYGELVLSPAVYRKACATAQSPVAQCSSAGQTAALDHVSLGCSAPSVGHSVPAAQQLTLSAFCAGCGVSTELGGQSLQLLSRRSCCQDFQAAFLPTPPSEDIRMNQNACPHGLDLCIQMATVEQ